MTQEEAITMVQPIWAGEQMFELLHQMIYFVSMVGVAVAVLISVRFSGS